MEKTLSLADFYRTKFGILPSEIIGKIGQFNVFSVGDYIQPDHTIPYSRKDYYKISLISGSNTVHYADKSLVVESNMLLFANPQVPYNWEPLTLDKTGSFCVFTEDFFKGYGDFKAYPLFQPHGIPILDLNDEEFKQVWTIYDKMFAEIASDYIYKYDVLRNLVTELIHTALKMRPAIMEPVEPIESRASDRITSLFFELLERQFPIESTVQSIRLHSPSDYAHQLNIHVNHLNKVLNETVGKTTKQLISERIALEARALLKHTNWTIDEIAFCLGFDDSSHFIKFFKKNGQATPKEFRKNGNRM
ncbi:MAG: putative AraC family transcriptional regulator [Bacteroidetes bacterium]|nr:putative AraC family transcriptional regulator [Bacteroidota bacterium]